MKNLIRLLTCLLCLLGISVLACAVIAENIGTLKVCAICYSLLCLCVLVDEIKDFIDERVKAKSASEFTIETNSAVYKFTSR